MRERALDEFESIFEQASIPVLDIHEVSLSRLVVVLEDCPLDDSLLEIARHLKSRFGCEVEVMIPTGGPSKSVRARIEPLCFDLSDRTFSSTAELVGHVSIAGAQMVLLPEVPDVADRIVNLDDLVLGTTPPVLIVRQVVDDASHVFRSILHSLTGNFQQAQNFSYSFKLVTDDGALLLLHVVNEQEVGEVRDSLQVAPDISAEEGEGLLNALAGHGERYLKAVVHASRDECYDVSYRLAVGEVVPAVEAMLRRQSFGLLVVGKHTEGRSRVGAEDYQLMHMVRDIPVLAL